MLEPSIQNREGFTFYFGASSGSSRKALQKMEEPNVMLNYATARNRPWKGIKRLFMDSGGYSFMRGKGEYETTNEEYLTTLAEYEPQLWALRDYPCEPDILSEYDRTVEDHQQMTIDRHRDLLDAYEDHDHNQLGQPVSVLQGWSVNDYIEHIDAMKDAGTLTEYVGIGSVCRRFEEDAIRSVVLRIAEELPTWVSDIHAFGVKGSVLRFPQVREVLSSSDSHSYDMQARWYATHNFEGASQTWRDSAFEYLKQKRRIKEVCAGNGDADMKQSSLFSQDFDTDEAIDSIAESSEELAEEPEQPRQNPFEKTIQTKLR